MRGQCIVRAMIKAAIVNDTGGKGHYGCDLVMARLREELARAGGTEVWSHPVGVDWQPLENELLNRPQVDVVIVNGEGSIHHSATRPRARYLPAMGPFAKNRLNAGTFLINATICDIDQSVADDLKAFDAIFVRDDGSRRALAEYGLTSRVVADLTLGASLPSADKREGIGVTDSVLGEAAADLAKLAIQNGWNSQVMHDRKRAKSGTTSFWSRFGRGKHNDDFGSFARFLSSHKLIVTGRYHTVTMCIATRTPFVALESNTPKISWLLDDVFGNNRRLIEASALQSLSTEQYATWAEQERGAIETAVTAAKTGASEMFREICAGPKREKI